MLKKSVFFVVFAALAIANLSATLAQSGFQTSSTWQTNPYAQLTPTESTPEIQPASTDYENHLGVTYYQASSYPVLTDPVPVSNAYVPLTTTSDFTYAADTTYAPGATYTPDTTYAPDTNFAPVSPIQPICDSGG